MIKISPLVSNLYAVRRFLTYSQAEDKESMEKFVPSERNTSVLNPNGMFGNSGVDHQSV
jgi:hypothetical protein